MREGGIGLKKMAAGIFGCYHNAGVLPPKLLYTDPDCCGERNISSLFQDWTRLLIRLDVWYFIRCIATGCTTESHPLYGLFMAQLSHCIFEWSDEELTENVDIVKCLSKNQLSLHVRRRTRGVETTADRKSTRLNSSHANISYAVFCLKKKKKHKHTQTFLSD